MATDERRPGSDPYRTARKWLAALVFVVVAVLAMIDALRTDYAVEPLVLGPLLISGLALLAIDAPGLRGGSK